ncbi:MAG: cation-translocating P-type ATPase C-terminal domain-containing protein [Burkholderiales bacterium]
MRVGCDEQGGQQGQDAPEGADHETPQIVGVSDCGSPTAKEPRGLRRSVGWAARIDCRCRQQHASPRCLLKQGPQEAERPVFDIDGFGWPALLYPMHIAFLEFIIDPACSIAFENEPAESDVMQRPPRDAAAPLFGGATMGLALVQGLGVLAVVMAAFAWASARIPEPEARAFAFATLVVGNLALILSNRSATRSLWATLRTPNRTLWGVVGSAWLLLLAALYIPWAVDVLRFAPLPAHELAAACGLGLLSVVWFEGIKWVRRRTRKSGGSGAVSASQTDRPVDHGETRG